MELGGWMIHDAWHVERSGGFERHSWGRSNSESTVMGNIIFPSFSEFFFEFDHFRSAPSCWMKETLNSDV